MQIVPVASGKGGVGKTLVAANLAIALAQANRRVILADLDLGGSNLHLVLGLNVGGPSIGTFLGRKKIDFSEVIHETGIPNLHFIPGDAEIPGLANLSASQKNAIVRRLSGLEADYLILDLGAGTSQNTLDFFLMSGQGIIVTTPTPTATVNAYLFLKNAAFRLLQRSANRKSPGGKYIDSLFRERNSLQRIYIPDVVRELESRDPEAGHRYREAARRFHPRLIMNMIDDPKDAETVTRLRRSTHQYLDLDLLHLGIIYRDALQDVALSSRLPILRYKPQSVLSQAIYRIAEKMESLQAEESDGFLDLEAVNDSYDAAGQEAEQDFESRMSYIEDLLSTGALSTGDLVETVKSQHHEIVQLKRQNGLYKAKLVAAMKQGFQV
jgi:flagellar biosynthesis protein FlhG